MTAKASAHVLSKRLNIICHFAAVNISKCFNEAKSNASRHPLKGLVCTHFNQRLQNVCYVVGDPALKTSGNRISGRTGELFVGKENSCSSNRKRPPAIRLPKRPTTAPK